MIYLKVHELQKYKTQNKIAGDEYGYIAKIAVLNTLFVCILDHCLFLAHVHVFSKCGRSSSPTKFLQILFLWKIINMKSDDATLAHHLNRHGHSKFHISQKEKKILNDDPSYYLVSREFLFLMLLSISLSWYCAK